MEIDSQFWSYIKNQIKAKNLDNKLLETWLDPISFVNASISGQMTKIVLGVPSQLHQYFVVENLLEKIHSEIANCLKTPFDVDLTVTGFIKPTVVEPTISNLDTQVGYSNHNKPNYSFNGSNLSNQMNTQGGFPTGPTTQRNDQLNPEYVFSTFVVGRNTEFAHAASFNVAQNPGSEGYNPLFICGPVGMGKTHLLHAVGNQIKQAYPHLRINYISAERFLNECVSAIRRQEMDKFRLKYRENSDIFLVDDVQYIGRGEAVQEEFFHTINAFIERKKQVVVASDRMPKDILGLEDRSRSRLEWGLIADISMPDLETRVAILRYKAEKMNIRLTEEVVLYIAKISKRSIRELEGNLKKVKMFSELQGLHIDLELAKRVLATHETKTTISVEEVQKLVADHYKVKVTDLKATSRAKQIVVPRQIAMWLIKKHLDKSLMDIGRAFGGKDHTTVMNALERVVYLQSTDLDIKNDIEELTTRIHNITGL